MTIRLIRKMVEAAAHAVWRLLLHFEQRTRIDQPFTLPPGVVACSSMRTKESFFRDLRTLRMCVHLISFAIQLYISPFAQRHPSTS